MTRILKNDPEIEKAQIIAREMLASGASMNQVRVRVNKECPGMDYGTKRWTLLEIEREHERGSLPGAIYSPSEATDSPGAGADPEQPASGKKRGVRVRRG